MLHQIQVSIYIQMCVYTWGGGGGGVIIRCIFCLQVDGPVTVGGGGGEGGSL